MFNESLLPNAVGAIAIAVTTVMLMRRSNRGILVVTGIAVCLWALHYWLLGSMVGATTHVEGGLFYFAAAGLRRADAGRLIRWSACTANTLLIAMLTFAFWRGPHDLLPLLGGSIFGVSALLMDGETMRWGFIAGEATFGMFALTVGSAPGLAVGVINIISGLVGLHKIRSHRCRTGVATGW